MRPVTDESTSGYTGLADRAATPRPQARCDRHPHGLQLRPLHLASNAEAGRRRPPGPVRISTKVGFFPTGTTCPRPPPGGLFLTS